MASVPRTHFPQKKPSLFFGLPVVLTTFLGYGYFAYSTWSDWIRASLCGRPAEAVILECTALPGKIGTNRITYRFLVLSPNGEGRDVKGQVTARDACGRYPAGSPAGVRYVASDPGISALDGVNPLPDTFGWISVFGAGISCLMLLLVLAGWMRFSVSRFWMKGVHE